MAKTTITAGELRELQTPIKERYRTDPDSATITLSASGKLHSSEIACSVDTGRALVKAGLHPATGGDGTFACSGDMLLEALVACAGVTLRAVATAMGITIHHGVVYADGNLDFRGTLGVDKAAPVGFRNISLRFEVNSDADEEGQATLLKLTERYCVVYQTLTQTPQITVSFNPVKGGDFKEDTD
jgi:uncharacterized OsmC-like protein|tara:strand:- start:1083 stop:1637 length:555 start_codon:yes stop_codon:yes gene_type:complete